jgi:uncharacterized membrane protein
MQSFNFCLFIPYLAAEFLQKLAWASPIEKEPLELVPLGANVGCFPGWSLFSLPPERAEKTKAEGWLKAVLVHGLLLQKQAAILQF